MIDLEKNQPKYYAMIDGERKGPIPLEELPAAGVRPSTYVWTAGMEDWEKAEDVADICRLFRVRLHDLMHPSSVAAEQAREIPAVKPAPAQQSAGSLNRFMSDVDLPTLEEIDARENHDNPPANVLPLAILVTLLFCPILGVIGVYYSLQSKKSWKKGEKQEAYDNCRSAKMWTGLGFFIGIIAYAFVIHFRL
ncbi:MAG: CD225/dispanin family protein [Muribaculaceae bacterium]|nr:CD225/dispanin family protein [Muribaculaceae bacterium]